MESNKNNYLPSGIYALDYEVKYNCRGKYIPTVDGSLKLVEEMYCNRFIFNPDNVEEHNRDKRIKREKWDKMLDEMYDVHNYTPVPTTKEENLSRSKRRAKNKIIDIILCNNFDIFVTLTLNPNEIDCKKEDYKTVIKKLNTYLDNRVRRNGLLYVGVPELQKNGNIHFHFLCNSSALKLVHSGTYIMPCGGKPRKEYTVKKHGYNIADCKNVYNIVDWTLGFTTAIETYGSIEAVANYIGKYITKSNDKIGGRWYYSGGKLIKPLYIYTKVSFDDVDNYTYDFDCSGGKFKIRKYNETN